MKNKSIEDLEQYFKHTVHVSGSNAEIRTQNLINNQGQRWFSYLNQAFGSRSRVIRVFNNGSQIDPSNVFPVINGLFSAELGKSGYMVSGKIPLIEHDGAISPIDDSNFGHALFYFGKLSIFLRAHNYSIDGQWDAADFHHLTEYTLEYPLFAEGQPRLVKALEAVERQEATLRNLIDSVQGDIGGLKSQVSIETTKAVERIDGFIASGQKNLEDLISAAKSKNEIKDIDIWAKRSDDLLNKYRVNWFMFLLLVSVSVFFIGNNFDVILKRAGEFKEIHKFVLIFGLPVVVFLSVSRHIFKMMNLNAALRSDALHRDSLINTYIYLMSSPHARMISEDDRKYMLQALFRPIEGSEKEETVPANMLSELLKPR